MKNADGSVTFSLETPIRVEGDEVTSLTLKRPNGKHWRKLNFERLRSDGDHMATIIGELAAIPPSAVDQLSWPDLAQLSTAVMDFFERSPPTGGTPLRT